MPKEKEGESPREDPLYKAAVLIVTAPYVLGISPIGELTTNDIKREIESARGNLEELLTKPEQVRRNFVATVLDSYQSRSKVDFSGYLEPLNNALNIPPNQIS